MIVFMGFVEVILVLMVNDIVMVFILVFNVVNDSFIYGYFF